MIVKQPIPFESDDMFKELDKEIQDVLKKLVDERTNQSWRRVLIRSIFSAIESSCFRMKQEALFFCNEFEPEEVSLLEEDKYILNDKGKAMKKFYPLKTEHNVRFAFRSLAKAWDVEFKLNVGDTGWESFKKALNKRHSVTHPKRIEDLVVTEEDIKDVDKAISWFNKSNIELLEAIRKKYLLKKLKKNPKI